MHSNLRRMIPKRHKKKTSPFFVKLFLAMLLLSTFQFLIFIATFYASGNFSYVKNYSYSMLIEKTENRKNYIENAFNSKNSIVYEINKEVNIITENVLKENNASAKDLTTDKALSRQILMDSTEQLISLLRRTAANDAYIIIDTGTLYNQSHDNNIRPAIYLRDIDSSSSGDINNKDLLMENGSSEITNHFGLMLDSQWTAHMDITQSKNFDFYFKTIETAKINPDAEGKNLGYWSGFSKTNSTDQASLKYTMPLILDDGTVYGVIGIGFTEKALLRYMPANDFLSENACYILATDKGYYDSFIPEMHSGAIYSRIIDKSSEINREHVIEGEIYDFNVHSDVSMKTVGNIQEMTLYNSDSPYANEHWALVSIADKNSVLNIYNLSITVFILSFVISAILSIICSLFINKRITTPISKMIKALDNNKGKDEIVNFSSSYISEIDRLANAVTELQIDVKEQASRVSKIISMTEMGIGVFMYDPENGNVFVGESLIKLLNFKEIPAMDMTISFDEFKEYLSVLDKENVICGNKLFNSSINSDDETFTTRLHSPKKGTESAQWFKFTLSRYAGKVLGLVQDVTSAVLEMKKIEYERDYDVITGLLNRRAYLNKIDEAFREPKKLKIAAFIMWDLDNLKYVNDTYGHDFGDDYIKTAAHTFKAFEEYGGIVARMSGDEFNIFLSGYDSKDEIRKIIDDVRSRLFSSYCLLADGTHFKIRASGGISWYPDDSVSYDMLIKYADFAMYTIKHSTKGSIAEFDASTYNKDSILLTGVEEMNSIIDRQNIKYAFQSIISAKTGELYGYEALMRPQSDIFRSPLEFIRIAKTCAKLHEVERLTWILALRAFRRFINNCTISPDTKIFINSLSNCMPTDSDIKLIESENRELLGNIVLEILESEKANDSYVQQKQKLIKKWNGLTALDDFGSGYNSEYALLTLNPNIIKIDRSIISNCDKDISKYNIICNIVQIASVKNVTVLAEGVETFDEMKTVINCGVDLLQGYYFNRPCFEPAPVDDKIKAEIKKINAEKNL